MSSAPLPTRIISLSRAEFVRRFGDLDTSRALCGYTPPGDTHAVLTLLAHARPARVLEIGTAYGDMTANLTEWSPDDTRVVSIGIVRGMGEAGAPEQAYEIPSPDELGRRAGHFGKAHKAAIIAADSRGFDFDGAGPFDFTFIDGGHDLLQAGHDSRAVYTATAPGGWLVWHDMGSPLPWVRVREAIERAGFAEAVEHVEGTMVAFLRKGGGDREVAEEGRSPGSPAVRPPIDPRSASRRPLRIVWEGPQAPAHSFALSNRELCLKLIARGHDLTVVPTGSRAEDDGPIRLHPGLEGRVRDRADGTADVHVRHQWPPSFEPPPSGRWVVFQPWEFGSIPAAWVGPMSTAVDEVWAYTRYVRDCYIAAGVPAEKVHVVPLGVDPDVFRPGVPPMPLATSRRFRFLFVGGTIHRKGIDVLLDAYASAFTAGDDVCLVVQDFGVGSFYRGQTAEQRIERLRAAAGAPEVLYLERALGWRELAGLYAACDCLVHPYRCEGFGLPIAEAMACGLPAVVTGYGASLDFCDEENSYLVLARPGRFAERRVGEIETVDYPWLAEPDPRVLASTLRRAAADPEETRRKGRVASEHIRGRFTWAHAASAVEARLEALRRMPVRRTADGREG
jgi:glycosyltransferase involved in cell wall biosynthesis/predicted O-methyltransferase YrrM